MAGVAACTQAAEHHRSAIAGLRAATTPRAHNGRSAERADKARNVTSRQLGREATSAQGEEYEMIGKGDIRDGMGVFGADAKRVGTVDGSSADDFLVDGRQIARSVISRIAHDRIYLKGKSTQYLARDEPRA